MAVKQRNANGQFAKSSGKAKTPAKSAKSTKPKSSKSSTNKKKTTAVTKRASNPSTPAKTTKKKVTKRKPNPSTQTKVILQNAAVGAGSFIAPGLLEVLTKGAISEKIAKMFAGKDKALTYKNYATAKVTINAALFGAAWYFTKKGKVAKWRTPILTGLGGALGVALVDMLFEPKKVDDMSARVRTILGLPPMRPTTYPYAPGKAPAPQPQPQPQPQANTGAGTAPNPNAIPGITPDQQQALDDASDPFGMEGLGNVTEYWERSLGNVEELWTRNHRQDLGDVDIIDEVDDIYSDDEAAYGGGSYLPSGSAY